MALPFLKKTFSLRAFHPQVFSEAPKLFVFVFAVSFFLEVTDVGRAIDFAADRAGEFLHLAELLVLADEARGGSFGFTFQWRGGEFDLELRVVDTSGGW